MIEHEMTPEEEADLERRALAQAACATAIGFNQMALDAKTLGEKAYARECRKAWVDQAKSLGVELRFGDHGAEPPAVLTLEVPGGPMWIKFQERDIELMRACVAEYDARKVEVMKVRRDLSHPDVMHWMAIAHDGDVNAQRAEDLLRSAMTTGLAECERLRTENTYLREELAHVLADWSALREAIGSPTNGGAIGWATQLRKTAHDVVALAESRRHGVWIPASAFSGLSKIVGESRIKDDDYP